MRSGDVFNPCFTVSAVSPCASSFTESLSSLRWAGRAACVINHPVLNEDPSLRVIRDLREEVSRLKALLTAATMVTFTKLRTMLATDFTIFIYNSF